MTVSRFLCVSSLVSVLSALPGVAVAEHAWGSYHWARTANPFTLQVVDSVTAAWDVQLADSLTVWSVSSVLDLTVSDSNDAGNIRKRCPMVLGQMRVCNSTYGFNGWLGLATIGIDSNGHIDRGTAKMNDSYASYWDIPGEKNHVMCQEIGHVFGLGHTSEDASSQKTCMDYSSDLDSQWPNDHDYEMLGQIYAQLDSYNSFADGSSGGGGDDGGGSGCNAPPGKGCNKNSPGDVPPMGIRVHKGRFEEIWVASRPDGGLWVHHVRLVPEDFRHR